MPSISRSKKEGGVQAVVFALNTLEYLAHRQQSVGVSDLARAFDTTKSRMHRHLQTLVKAGYIVRETETERYRASTRLLALGRAIGDGFDLSIAARPVMRRLRESLGSSVVLSKPEIDGVRILLLMHGKSPVEIGVKPGALLRFHDSAQGKIALAFGEAGIAEEVLARELPMSTPCTITDPQRLTAEIGRIRERGWAVAPNEAMTGFNALAAPVLDAFGKLDGAVAIVDSIQLIAESPSPDQVRCVLEAAAEISADLGYRPG